MKVQKLSIHDLELQCYTWGKPENPLLLCLHGWLDTAASFNWLSEALLHQEKESYFIVAPDLRGYGKSEHTKNPLGYFFFEYVADVHAIAKHFSGEKPFVLLGHSLGGAIASVYAGSYPEQVSHFINLEGFGFQRTDGMTPSVRARNWIESFPPKDFKIYPDWEALAKRLCGINPRLSPERALFLAKHLGEDYKGGVRMAADPKHKVHEPYTIPNEIFYSFWRSVTAKSLFVDAEETEMKLFYETGRFGQVMEERRKNFPQGCITETMLGCGHMMHHEKPEDLAKMIKAFL